MPSHAEDLAAVLGALSTGPVVVAGHSTGAFAFLVLANLFPERVRSLVLVDGGLPLQVPVELRDEQIVAAVPGPAAERLNATFASREVYRSFWKQHPAFSADWGPSWRTMSTTTAPERNHCSGRPPRTGPWPMTPGNCTVAPSS
ncbi:pimeloyl-ACP methyl ester carboxylesterase [Arthrobacter sp. MP_M7]|nr:MULTISPECIES: alpha/beta hydrolase [unclassified Arthrobacter]MEC5190562.1 pimeloyl-ACP methyl ester carboxylesterase [Arthrobacter sp. MP_M4]MEC5201913.1 pimeloyl-ACP methyl ester carboxylesterase [Arthrobacter sp. MP_M7]